MKALLLLGLLIVSVQAESYYWKRVDTGYKKPVDMKAIPGSDRFLVLEQKGYISVTDLQGTRTRILDWSDRISSSKNERGLLCLAFSPDFTQSGRAYLNLTNKKGDTEIWRVILDQRSLKLRGEERLLSIDQPYWNHNGGWLGFGPDKMLYIATGDGGSRNDPKNKAQDLSSLLGKMLRIDVSARSGYTIPSTNPFLADGDARPEIYAYGLRNPWRCHWHQDRLYIADVGQNDHEEINCVTLRELKGANFGWRLREGNVATPKRKVGGDLPPDHRAPILTYPHDGSASVGGYSITGGVVYTGEYDTFRNHYLFADFALPRVWSLRLSNGRATGIRSFSESVLPDQGEIYSISSFATNHQGEVYLLCFSGDLFKLTKHQ